MTVPFWPETDAELDLVETVANAALAEVGIDGSWAVQADGFSHFMGKDGRPLDDIWDDAHRALQLGWDSAARLRR